MKINFAGLGPPQRTKNSTADVTDRIAAGKVVPIVGNSFTDDLVFGSHEDLVQGWAAYTRYPYAEEGHSLPQVAQYSNVVQNRGASGDDMWLREDYIRFLKAALQLVAEQQEVSSNIRREVKAQERELTPSQIARRFGFPSFNSPEENPLLILAALPLPIYITTSYHDYLEVALREKMNKQPRTEICFWHERLYNIPSVLQEQGYEPSPQQPLVYHLHGFDAYPESLVLTEDDYLDFLSNISKDAKAIPPRVKQALTDSSLVLIGYQPHEWDFRVLFRGLIAPRPRSLASIAIQLEENPTNKEYIQSYLHRADFEVVWKSPGEFIMELYEGWGGP